MKTFIVLPASALAIAFAAAASAAAAVPVTTAAPATSTTDVIGQGHGGPVVAPDGATIRRSASGVSAKLTMPAPEPGSYDYPGGNAFQPDGAYPGHPEAFSLWVFVFNHPEQCSDGVCNSDDLGATPALGGAFSGGGHLVGGSHLQLSGRVTVNSAPFVGSMLTEPETAEIHLAVAPHGALQPHILPDQISKPIGDPSYWWLAEFPKETP